MVKRIQDGHGDSYSLQEFREAVLEAIMSFGEFHDARGATVTGSHFVLACREVVRGARGYIRSAWQAGCCPHSAGRGAWEGRRTERDFDREAATLGAGDPSCVSATVH